MQADSAIIGLVSSVASDRIIVAGGFEADAGFVVIDSTVICERVVAGRV